MVRQLSPNALTYFDWGTDCTRRRGALVACNQMRYGQVDPPTYALGSIQAKIAVFTGGQPGWLCRLMVAKSMRRGMSRSALRLTWAPDLSLCGMA